MRVIGLVRTMGISGAVCMVLPGAVLAASADSHDPCLRRAVGSSVPEPQDLRSRNGVLKVELTVRDHRESDGSIRYCYLLADGTQSPTLRFDPGDLLRLSLKNELIDPLPDSAASHHSHNHAATATQSS